MSYNELIKLLNQLFANLKIVRTITTTIITKIDYQYYGLPTSVYGIPRPTCDNPSTEKCSRGFGGLQPQSRTIVAQSTTITTT